MSMAVPLFDLNYDEREEKAVLEVFKRKWLSIGPECDSFEQEFSRAIKAPFALSLANCTAALHLAMLLLNIGEGDEVILPSLTFVATANAVRYVGATPVFADVTSLEDLTINPEDIERCITPNTKAIIVMHYGGHACEMHKISALAQKHSLKIIEDACHAPLAVYDDIAMGLWGDVGCFSFFSNKNLSTGEGGMIVMKDEALFDHAKLLRSHGMTTLSYQRAQGHSSGYDVVGVGYNYRMDDIHAALGRVQLEKLPADIAARKNYCTQYYERLKMEDDLILPFAHIRGSSSYYIFPCWIDGGSERRDGIRAYLKDHSIMTSMHYPPVHHFTVYKPFARDVPMTERAANGLITLPLYGHMGSEAVDYVCDKLSEALRSCPA
ncbi:MAG: DegT/DnrJ/EryC1/StrS family aminotransferase [Alphaproteobacteria bacterium]|nr:DegT/DnrJ/EryC1/StrS family aminotransferase [Alphaproteobacteria bacterium]NCQ89127.1 DegT/DnrJ/EryC1/StrS family aminotransferase [Alphaproteobacteria bacterium]NCT08231.1 DegT/DnrJ/EryC1/StrS family aminotransferase [Alphaproteobacteria bacterium]